MFETTIGTVAMRLFFSILFLFALHNFAFAAGDSLPPDQVSRGITAEGSCAVVGMSAEQSQLTALQRARAAAIEQVSGIAVSSTTLVTDFKLAADFIKTYSKGLVVKERVEWLPLGQYQKDASMPPIPEYRVRIVADVFTPDAKVKPIGLQAKIDRSVYRCGEKLQVEVKAGRKAKVAIFNIMANDEVAMVFPNEHERNNIVSPGSPLLFPSKNSGIELITQNLPNHQRDAEALLVVALDESFVKDLEVMFPPGEGMKLQEFFRRFADMAEYGEDVILAYEIVEGRYP